MANMALPTPQMEVEKPPPGPEPPTLLKTYKWRTAAPMGDREPEKGAGSPGSRRWTRLQGWKRSYSQPESDGPDDGGGKGSSSLGAPKASTRRSLFQRAFSAPSKGTKETRGPEGGKATLQKYLRSMSKKKGHGESGARAEQVLHDAVPGMGVPVPSTGVPTGDPARPVPKQRKSSDALATSRPGSIAVAVITVSPGTAGRGRRQRSSTASSESKKPPLTSPRF
ncbi:hypothetical protein QYF61_021478 [Mycteria americana]|uniref:Uncharacterized protein n=1 Tax=Mycteria americana TaxID=33587 RepID=A0AAN7MHL9_MYCAM|nr:hypothetical protein QYF61_021478 [Mycteria americana]